MSKLVAAIYEKPGTKDHAWTRAFAAGLNRHGIQTKTYPYKTDKVKDADLHVFWALRASTVMAHCHAKGQPFIVLDHGFTPDRKDFTAINLNHLNGRSELDVAAFAQDSARCAKHGWGIKPAPAAPGQGILIIGQVSGDRSLEGADIYNWANFKIAELELLGHRNVQFKPHPREKPENLHRIEEVKAPLFKGSMEDAFAAAKVILTYSSTAGAEAWQNGVAAWAASPMSMIYREQFEPATPARRQRWLNEISYRQYNKEEMRSGEAWDILADRIIGRGPGRALRDRNYRNPRGELVP